MQITKLFLHVIITTLIIILSITEVVCANNNEASAINLRDLDQRETPGSLILGFVASSEPGYLLIPYFSEMTLNDERWTKSKDTSEVNITGTKEYQDHRFQADGFTELVVPEMAVTFAMLRTIISDTEVPFINKADHDEVISQSSMAEKTRENLPEGKVYKDTSTGKHTRLTSNIVMKKFANNMENYGGFGQHSSYLRTMEDSSSSRFEYVILKESSFDFVLLHSPGDVHHVRK